VPRQEIWSRTSTLAADSAAAGKFEDAMRLLNQQIGIVNFGPLRSHFLRLYQSATAHLIGLGSLPAMAIPLERDSNEGPRQGSTSSELPRIAIGLQPQINQLSEAYRTFTNGKFNEAMTLFECILFALPLVVANTRNEANEIKELIGICREYLVGISAELARKDVVQNKGPDTRILELSAYFTHCELQPKHLHLTLKSAMNAHARVNNYGMAADFGRRLLDLNPPQPFVEHAQKVLVLCDKKTRTNAVALDYDSRNPFVLCGYTLTPIYQGSPTLKCPYCGTSYKPEFNGKICKICQIAEIGKTCSGIQLESGEGKRKPKK